MPTAVIAQGGGDVAEVSVERGGPGGEDPSEGLVAVLVVHVVRVREGADRDVEGGVPRCLAMFAGPIRPR